MREFIIQKKESGELVRINGKFTPFKIGKDYSEGYRVFYEHGAYDEKDVFIRSNEFIEIVDVTMFQEIGGKDLKDQSFIDHHNFMCLEL